MNLLAFLIALNSPALDCSTFSDVVWREIASRTTDCGTMCKMIVLDNPELITASAVSQDSYTLYAKRTCVIYNRIIK